MSNIQSYSTSCTLSTIRLDHITKYDCRITFPYISIHFYPFFTWISSPVDWKPCITETWHHLQVWAPTFFRLEMDASKSPIRFFTRARMNRKCGWFLQDAWGAARIRDSNRILRILSKTSWSHNVTVLFMSTGFIRYHLPYLYLPSNRNTTKAAEDSDCFNAKPLRACFSALAWNHFHRKRRFQKKLTALPPLHADPRKCGTLPANTWVKLSWNIQRGKWR